MPPSKTLGRLGFTVSLDAGRSEFLRGSEEPPGLVPTPVTAFPHFNIDFLTVVFSPVGSGDGAGGEIGRLPLRDGRPG